MSHPQEIAMRPLQVRLEPTMKTLNLSAKRSLAGVSTLQPHGLQTLIERHMSRLPFYQDHHRVSDIIIAGHQAELTEEGIHPTKGQYRRYRLIHPCDSGTFPSPFLFLELASFVQQA